MILKLTSIVIGLLISTSSVGHKLCWKLASDRYDIPVIVLKAIAYVESHHQPSAVRKNRNGSIDYGLMQVNTRWLPYLKEYAIDMEALKKPCVNILVGAWILKQEIIRFGFNWRAIGAYHAGAHTNNTMKIKLERYKSYSAKVYRYIERSY